MTTTILVLDDEEKLRDNLAKHLRRMKTIETVFDYATADDLITELEKLDPFPDIFILDINMPGKYNGITALTEIKEKDPSARVFMFTSSEEPTEHDMCRKLGAEAVIVKPIGRIAMKAALTQMING